MAQQAQSPHSARLFVHPGRPSWRFTIPGHSFVTTPRYTPSDATKTQRRRLLLTDVLGLATAGIGTSILPIRFNMPPEVAIVTIGQRKE